jgi:hypothetical protein
MWELEPMLGIGVLCFTMLCQPVNPLMFNHDMYMCFKANVPEQM